MLQWKPLLRRHLVFFNSPCSSQKLPEPNTHGWTGCFRRLTVNQPQGLYNGLTAMISTFYQGVTFRMERWRRIHIPELPLKRIPQYGLATFTRSSNSLRGRSSNTAEERKRTTRGDFTTVGAVVKQAWLTHRRCSRIRLFLSFYRAPNKSPLTPHPLDHPIASTIVTMNHLNDPCSFV